MANKFNEYQAPGETLCPTDLMARRRMDPIFLSVFKDEAPIFVQFYAFGWKGGWARQDRGHGHGTDIRTWEFRCWAQRAVGGTINKLEWGRWVAAKLSFVEGRPGVLFRMKA